jgi:serine/threonine protein kinase
MTPDPTPTGDLDPSVSFNLSVSDALSRTEGAPSGAVALTEGAEPVPGFVLTRRLGGGGFGQVWEADGPGGKRVALKFVPLGEEAARVEFNALAEVKDLNHPHLLSLFASWQRSGFLILALELAEGTLMQRLAEAQKQGRPGIPFGELLEQMREAAKGLDFLNGKGIQHRDVKPQNLLLVGGCVKVGDLGLAKLMAGTAANASSRFTANYVAPEQLRGQIHARTDQYALAVSYCQLRGGRLPFQGDAAQVLTGHLMEPPDLSMLPAPERAAAARALSKEPAQRWPSCRDFVEALAAASSRPVPPLPPSPIAVPPKLPPPPAPRRRGAALAWAWVVGGLALTALVVYGSLVVLRPRGTERTGDGKGASRDATDRASPPDGRNPKDDPKPKDASKPAAPPVLPDPVNLSGFHGEVGKAIVFQVTGSTTGTVWGSGVYTDDSPLAAAAVHAGALKDGQKGLVRVTILPGQAAYAGSTRNGVTSNSYGEWSGSYRVEAVNFVNAPWPDPGDLSGFRGEAGKTFLFEVTGSTIGSVWGSGVYTDDSALAAAAVHAGALKAGQKGLVRVTILPGRAGYAGSTSNGVTSDSWGEWSGSYRVEAARD